MGNPSYKFVSKDCTGSCVGGHPGLQMAADLMMNNPEIDFLTAFKATKVKLAANASLNSTSVAEAASSVIVAAAANLDKGGSGRSA